jgi:hypothetical protein
VNREQLAHVLRAASRITGDSEIVVIGSQAILGTYDDRQLPEEATRSIEADLAFRIDPDDAKANDVDGAIGELSMFHQTHGYYAQGVSVSTAVLPRGWEERVVHYGRTDAEPSRAVCIEAHDLVVSKLVAGREKDVEFATALIAAGLVSTDTLLERSAALSQPGGVTSRVDASIRRCERAAARFS